MYTHAGTRVTLAITQAGCGVRRTGTGIRDAVFLGEEKDPQSAAIVAFYGKTGHAGGLGGKVAWHSPKPDGTRDLQEIESRRRGFAVPRRVNSV